MQEIRLWGLLESEHVCTHLAVQMAMYSKGKSWLTTVLGEIYLEVLLDFQF